MARYKVNSFIILLLTWLCTVMFNNLHAAESPVFIKTKDWHLDQLADGKLILTCKAVFYNPNKAKAKLLDVSFNAFLGETKAGKINQTDTQIRIKKKQAFEIPLRIVISPETNAWGYIQGILSALTFQDFLLHIRGYISVRLMGIKFKITVDETEQLNVKNLLGAD